MLVPQRVIDDLEELENEGRCVSWRTALALNKAGVIATQSSVEFDSIWLARRVCKVCGVALFEPTLMVERWLEECSRLYSPAEYDFLRLVAITNDEKTMAALLDGDFKAVYKSKAAGLAGRLTGRQLRHVIDWLFRTDEPKMPSGENETDGLEDIALGVAIMGASNVSDIGLSLSDWLNLPRGKAYALLRRAYSDSPAYKDQKAEAEIEYNTILDELKNGESKN